MNIAQKIAWRFVYKLLFLKKERGQQRNEMASSLIRKLSSLYKKNLKKAR